MPTAVVPAATAVHECAVPLYHQPSAWPSMVSVAVVSSMSLAVSLAEVSPSSLIVPVAVASPSVAPTGFLSVTVKVSSGSGASSSCTRTNTLSRALLFAGKISVRDTVLKSAPLLAVPLDVATSTVTRSRLGCDRDTVNSIQVPSSATSASDTLTVGVPSGARVLNFVLASLLLHVLSL